MSARPPLGFGYLKSSEEEKHLTSLRFCGAAFSFRACKILLIRLDAPELRMAWNFWLKRALCSGNERRRVPGVPYEQGALEQSLSGTIRDGISVSVYRRVLPSGS